MPRREAGRLASGKGRYTDDIATADVGHVAFLRSPHCTPDRDIVTAGRPRPA
jgi:CO/xanthine dehydrogenase Mo-binding subunit